MLHQKNEEWNWLLIQEWNSWISEQKYEMHKWENKNVNAIRGYVAFLLLNHCIVDHSPRHRLKRLFSPEIIPEFGRIVHTSFV